MGRIWTLILTVGIGTGGWAMTRAIGAWPLESATAAADPESAREHTLVSANVDQPADPGLAAEYQAINFRFFAGGLPPIPVRWESGLGTPGSTGEHAFTLEGLFGHLGSRSVILLNPSLRQDPAARTRALCHEIVHASLFAAGDVSSNHGPAFQVVLRRLASQGAFVGTPATDEERESLHAWLDAESARIDAERDAMAHLSEDLDRERAGVEHALESGDAADVAARREAYNARAIAANDRLDHDRDDVAHFNAEVDRYNKMLVYPDGLDDQRAERKKVGSREVGKEGR
jgi:hypothetical protein